MSLSCLPPELLTQILTHLPYPDLATLSLLNHSYHTFISPLLPASRLSFLLTEERRRHLPLHHPKPYLASLQCCLKLLPARSFARQCNSRLCLSCRTQRLLAASNPSPRLPAPIILRTGRKVSFCPECAKWVEGRFVDERKDNDNSPVPEEFRHGPACSEAERCSSCRKERVRPRCFLFRARWPRVGDGSGCKEWCECRMHTHRRWECQRWFREMGMLGVNVYREKEEEGVVERLVLREDGEVMVRIVKLELGEGG